MKALLEIMTILDWTALPRTVVQTFMAADWGKAKKNRGLAGIGLEAASSLAGTNSYPFFVPLDSYWSGVTLANLLQGKGIRMWGVTYAHGEMFFRVRRNQAAWAHYVMQQAGVPLLHGVPSGARPPSPGASHAPAPAGSRTGKAKPRPRLVALLDWVESFLD